jgi:hypothetical protein
MTNRLSTTLAILALVIIMALPYLQDRTHASCLPTPGPVTHAQIQPDQ